MAAAGKKVEKPKVECRARTGGMYGRAGALWTSEFQDVSEEILKDEALMKLLEEDPHLELRVDGKYVTGPRANSAANQEPPAPGSDAEAATKRADALEAELDATLAQLTDMRSQRDEAVAVLLTAKSDLVDARATIAEQSKQLDALKSAPPAPTTPAAPPATETTPDVKAKK
jgi:hypothetical protein